MSQGAVRKPKKRYELNVNETQQIFTSLFSLENQRANASQTTNENQYRGMRVHI